MANEPEQSDRQFRPEVRRLIRGMGHPRSNIRAVHFDGPGLDKPLALAVEMERIKYEKDLQRR